VDWADAIQKLLALAGALGLGAFFNAKHQASLVHKAETERENRDALRRRLEAQSAAYTEFSDFCARYVPDGRAMPPATERLALSTKISLAFSAPTFAERVSMLLITVSGGDLDEERAPPGVNPVPPDLLAWIDDAKRELLRGIEATEKQLGIPKVTYQPVLTVPETWAKEFGLAPATPALPPPPTTKGDG
jgi:hypothetical protein